MLAQMADDLANVPSRSQQVAGLFDLVADTYDQVGVDFFAPIAKLLIDALVLQPGEDALDVGCGRGAVTLLLARATSGGSVTAVDLSPRMVAATAAACAAAGLTVTTAVADAGALTVPPSSYDVVASSLVVFFLPDPAAALEFWRVLLRPGGRLGITTFGAQSTLWDEVDALFRPYLPPHLLDPRTSGRGGPFATADTTTALVANAGFAAVITSVTTLPVHFASREKWREWTWSHGQRGLWMCVPDDKRDDVRDQAFHLIEPHLDADGGFDFTQEIRVTTATAPS